MAYGIGGGPKPNWKEFGNEAQKEHIDTFATRQSSDGLGVL